MTHAEALQRVSKVEIPRLLSTRLIFPGDPLAEPCLCCKAKGDGETVPANDTFINVELALAAILLLFWQDVALQLRIAERVKEAASVSASQVDAVSTEIANELLNQFDES